MSYDVIVIGLGAMGSAATYHLAKRGARVLGLDQFNPPHTLGSSHGESRVTRQAVGEGEAYIPLVQRAYELWRTLEAESGQQLLFLTGGYIICPAGGGAQFHGRSDFVAHTAALAQRYNIEHKLCTAAEVRRHLPMLRLGDHEHAYYEPSHGLLLPERCIEVQLGLARQNGATVQSGERVLAYRPDPGGVTVTTDRATYQAGQVVVSAGAWVADFLPEALRRHTAVYRQVIYWFEADDLSRFHADRFPWLIWIGQDHDDFFSVFSWLGQGTPGVKVLTEQYHRTTTPDQVDRTVQPHEIETMYERFVARRVEGLRSNCLKSGVCLYTVTPDEGFIIDFHPESRRVIVASPCSGHGFKHSAAVGEVLAQLALDGTSPLDLSPFSLARF
jgi:sarcosine oxidase